MMLWRFFVYQMPLQSLAPVNFSTAFVNSLKGELWKDPKKFKSVFWSVTFKSEFAQMIVQLHIYFHLPKTKMGLKRAVMPQNC